MCGEPIKSESHAQAEAPTQAEAPSPEQPALDAESFTLNTGAGLADVYKFYQDEPFDVEAEDARERPAYRRTDRPNGVPIITVALNGSAVRTQGAVLPEPDKHSGVWATFLAVPITLPGDVPDGTNEFIAVPVTSGMIPKAQNMLESVLVARWTAAIIARSASSLVDTKFNAAVVRTYNDEKGYPVSAVVAVGGYSEEGKFHGGFQAVTGRSPPRNLYEGEDFDKAVQAADEFFQNSVQADAGSAI